MNQPNKLALDLLTSHWNQGPVTDTITEPSTYGEAVFKNMVDILTSNA